MRKVWEKIKFVAPFVAYIVIFAGATVGMVILWVKTLAITINSAPAIAKLLFLVPAVYLFASIVTKVLGFILDRILIHLVLKKNRLQDRHNYLKWRNIKNAKRNN